MRFISSLFPDVIFASPLPVRPALILVSNLCTNCCSIVAEVSFIVTLCIIIIIIGNFYKFLCLSMCNCFNNRFMEFIKTVCPICLVHLPVMRAPRAPSAEILSSQ